MSLLVPKDNTRIEALEQLVDYLAQGFKPRARFAVGTEHEKLGWSTVRGGFPTYEGPGGIGELLERLAQDAGWAPTREGVNIVGLARDRATITLEPGGQLELSGAPLKTLAEHEAELDGHLSELRRFSEPLGLIWSGLGLAPIGTPDEMPRMPKARYDIMRRYMATRGQMALNMMHQTCTVQANFDYSDEADAIKKFQVSLYMQPLVLAAFANSTIVRGRVVPERSFRGRIWEYTDDDRYIYPPDFLQNGAGFIDYVKWAIDVPMFFIHREGRYIDTAGLPFRAFMKNGWQGHRAILGDFALHLSTLFPDTRLKQYLEVRGADMGSRDYVLALPALHKGILYDDQSLSAAGDLFKDVGYEDLWALRREVPVLGLSARLGQTTVQELMEVLISLSAEGLERLEPGSSRFLEGLKAAVSQGLSPADRLRNYWTGDVLALMRETRIA